MGVSKKWMKIIRKKLLASSNRYTSIPRLSTSTICSNESDNACMGNETSTSEDQGLPVSTKGEVAAMKIQACFRGHLARRAYRALRSLVKVQALVRGVLVRRQSRMALHCMHVLVTCRSGFEQGSFLADLSPIDLYGFTFAYRINDVVWLISMKH